MRRAIRVFLVLLLCSGLAIGLMELLPEFIGSGVVGVMGASIAGASFFLVKEE